MSTVFVSLNEKIPETTEPYIGLHYGFWADEYIGRLWFVLLGQELNQMPNSLSGYEHWMEFVDIPPICSFIGDNSHEIFKSERDRADGIQAADKLLRKLENKDVPLLTLMPELATSEFYRHCGNLNCKTCLSREETFNASAKDSLVELGEHFVDLLKGTLKTGEAIPQKIGRRR